MSDTRPLSVHDFCAAASIFANAYPGLKITSEEDLDLFRKRLRDFHEDDPAATFYGLFRQGQLLGIMCLYDYRMNFLQARVPVGAVGQVAVHLAHKKEQVAREMMAYALRHFRQQGTPLVTLYPFRPDFYVKMGFGYGTKMSQYRIQPASFPKGPSRSHLRYLDKDDRQAIVDCYQRFAARTHGMMDKSPRDARRLFERAEYRILGYEQDGQVRGYLVFTFEHGDDFITNDLHVQEWVYETPEALSELLTFLHTQADQIRAVVVDTQDEDFHHLVLDPRDGSGRLIPSAYHQTNIQGLGLLYRLVDVPAMFDHLAERDFGGQTCTLRLTVEDSFLPENAGSTLLRFEAGRVQRPAGGEPAVVIRLDIANFSSLLAGTVSFRSLYDYGLAEISDAAYVETVNRIFAIEKKPVCMTPF